MKPRVAVIGAGISGMAAAWHLRLAARPTLFEADPRGGGHAHTVDVTLEGRTFGVDTGFLVCNHRTYPGLMQLFRELDVRLAPSDMGFSVQVRAADGHSTCEWAGTGLRGLLAQPQHLASPRFWGMLADIVRFNRLATALATAGADTSMAESTGAFLLRHRFGNAFRDQYLIPMVACIWSCSPRQMLDFPIGTLIRFCHNHGLLQVTGQPQWYTVAGGSREYVRRMLAALPDVRLGTSVHRVRPMAGGVALDTAGGSERFDAVILACHSDQALRLLATAANAEQRQVLGNIRYQANRAVLHTDTALLPERRAAWAAWNYETQQASHAATAPEPTVCLHYWLNALQPLPTAQPVIVSLNPLREPSAAHVLAEFEYAHPIFDQAAIDAQHQLQPMQHRVPDNGIWLAGAWTGYGFHEDGYRSGTVAAQSVLRAWAERAPLPRAA